MIKYLILLLSFAIVTGCDNPFDSSSSEDSFVYEERRTVQYKSQATSDQQANGGLYVLQCGDVRVIVMDYTSISRLRNSCSGFDNSAQITNGDLITFFYAEEHTDWAIGEIRPLRIEAVPKSCIPEYAPEFICEPCGK